MKPITFSTYIRRHFPALKRHTPLEICKAINFNYDKGGNLEKQLTLIWFALIDHAVANPDSRVLLKSDDGSATLNLGGLTDPSTIIAETKIETWIDDIDLTDDERARLAAWIDVMQKWNITNDK